MSVNYVHPAYPLVIARNSIEIVGDDIHIELTQGEFAVIDRADFLGVAHLKWSPDGNGYARTRIWRGGKIGYPRLHRFLFGSDADGLTVDHINGSRWDCRRANLRLCSQGQNCLNRAVNTSNILGYKGVRWHKSGWYFVQIKKSGQQYRVGNFDTPEEAALAYDFLARKFFGLFARLNFPDDSRNIDYYTSEHRL